MEDPRIIRIKQNYFFNMTEPSKPTDKYAKILHLFVLKNDERPQLQLPWYQKEFVLASDAHNMVVFDKTLLTQVYFPPHEKHPDGLAIIPEENNVHEVITTKDITTAAKALFYNEQLNYTLTTQTCTDCSGNGQVEYVFTDYCSTDHKIKHDCPTCNASGSCDVVINAITKEVLDFKTYQLLIKYKNVYFRLSSFKKIVETANLLNQKEVRLIYRQHENGGKHVFKVGNVKILTMPIMENKAKPEDIVVEL